MEVGITKAFWLFSCVGASSAIFGFFQLIAEVFIKHRVCFDRISYALIVIAASIAFMGFSQLIAAIFGAETAVIGFAAILAAFIGFVAVLSFKRKHQDDKRHHPRYVARQQSEVHHW